MEDREDKYISASINIRIDYNSVKTRERGVSNEVTLIFLTPPKNADESNFFGRANSYRSKVFDSTIRIS